jgi:hypothetical protein
MSEKEVKDKKEVKVEETKNTEDSKLTITGAALLSLVEPLRQLSQGTSFSGEVFWNLVDLSTAVFTEESKLGKIRTMLVKKYSPQNEKGEAIEQDGMFRVANDKVQQYQAEWLEILSKDIVIDFPKVDVPKEQVNPRTMNPSQMLMLTPIINFTSPEKKE